MLRQTPDFRANGHHACAFHGRRHTSSIRSLHQGHFQSHSKECVTHTSLQTQRKCDNTHTFCLRFLLPVDGSNHKSKLKKGEKRDIRVPQYLGEARWVGGFPAGDLQVTYTASQSGRGRGRAGGQEGQRRGGTHKHHMVYSRFQNKASERQGTTEGSHRPPGLRICPIRRKEILESSDWSSQQSGTSICNSLLALCASSIKEMPTTVSDLYNGKH